MRTDLRRFFIAFLFLCSSYFGFAQSGEITIRFIGNCGLSMTDGRSHIYIDFPYKSGAFHYMTYDPVELKNIKEPAVFIFTHRHADHYSRKHLRRVTGKRFDPYSINELKQLSTILSEFEIEAFKTPHRVFGMSFKHYSYLITWHGKKIFISGDTESSAVLAQQREIDMAFVPVWVLTDARAKGITLKEHIKVFAIYHIGPRDNISNSNNDPQIKLLKEQGMQLSLVF